MKVPMCVVGSLILVAAPLAVTAQRAASPPPSVTLRSCLIKLIEEVEVPAQESGILQKLIVKEGDLVKPGDMLAQIDDALAQKQLTISQNELKVAIEQANNTVNERYATAAAAVAWAEWQAAIEANNKVPGTFPAMEVERLKLTFDRARLQIEQEQMNRRIAILEANVARAKVEAAQEVIRHRKIKAPDDDQESQPPTENPGSPRPITASPDGGQPPPEPQWVVEELYCHEGEWVEPPQTGQEHVMRLIRVDRLWVEGFVKATDFNRARINGRPVTVKVELDQGRVATVDGKIVFTGSEILHGGQYKVRAEVANRKASEQWLLQPGLRAEMTIRLR